MRTSWLIKKIDRFRWFKPKAIGLVIDIDN
jgi:hypothetical protein